MSGGNPPKSNYSKPWLSTSGQVALLKSRGLVINDEHAAEAFLRHVNYYRFAGYCLAFESSRHVFTPQTVTFEHVRNAYEFDAQLRDHFTEALELIEIDLCTSVAHYFGQRYGAFGHISATNFHNRFDYNTTHRNWLDKLHDETTRSRELFVSHFKKSYLEYPDLPIWAVTEIMSFGSLSRMIAALKKVDRQEIAKEYGVSARVMSSATHHLAYVRNLCAHHCRLWDRIWSIKSDMPQESLWSSVRNDRVFGTLLLMRKLLHRSPQIRPNADSWRDKLNALMASPPSVANAMHRMGFPSGWEKHPVWL